MPHSTPTVLVRDRESVICDPFVAMCGPRQPIWSGGVLPVALCNADYWRMPNCVSKKLFLLLSQIVGPSP